MRKSDMLILFTIASIIAILICTIIYCMFFSANGIFTIANNTKKIITNSYKEETEALSQYEKIIEEYTQKSRL